MSLNAADYYWSWSDIHSSHWSKNIGPYFPSLKFILTLESFPSIDCTDAVKVRTCGSEEFRCSSSLCIPVSWQCDGEIDCPGGLDEWEQICSELELTNQDLTSSHFSRGQ